MRIAWDVPILMDDGVVLRADLFRPRAEDRYPVILSYGPYAKGLAFQDGYPSAWERLTQTHPEVLAGSSGAYHELGGRRPGALGPRGLRVPAHRLARCGAFAGLLDPCSPREVDDYRRLHRVGRRAAVEERKDRDVRDLLLRDQPVDVASLPPPHLAACASGKARRTLSRQARHGGILARSAGLVRHAGEERAARPRRARAAQPRHRRARLPARRRSATGARARTAPTSPRARGTPARRRVPPRALARSGQDHRPAPLRGELGRRGLARARQLRGLRRRGLAAKVARSTRARALDRVLHRLRRRAAAALLRAVPQGRRQRRADAAARALEGAAFRPVRRSATRRNGRSRARAGRSSTSIRASASCCAASRPTVRSVAFEALGEGLTFLSAPLERQPRSPDPRRSSLFLSSSTRDADVFAVLRAFAPDGEEVVFQGAIDPHTPLAQGWLRASHRKLDPARSLPYRPFHPHDELLPLEPASRSSSTSRSGRPASSSPPATGSG